MIESPTHFNRNAWGLKLFGQYLLEKSSGIVVAADCFRMGDVDMENMSNAAVFLTAVTIQLAGAVALSQEIIHGLRMLFQKIMAGSCDVCRRIAGCDCVKNL